ncbi:hypothetical protein [Steroidobacter agaridevorans]|uniref:hypothetical protein n=1 Tax=Steroidobacter agaridevorans TaxID=2695856 RepID=UPI001327122A|nr:hypothetical protein [Steroidobacter agaridevorans]GFE87716.1 hypothetical protein GCM10011488_26700 [Steroidobacter agaridevorans]
MANKLDGVYDRLIAMMDNVHSGAITCDQADRIANGAEKIAKLLVVESQMIDMAWSNEREATPSQLAGSVIESDSDSSTASKCLPTHTKLLRGK